MKGIFWNSNGFGDAKKYQFLSDLTKEKGLDFMALSETGRRAFSDSFLKNLCGAKEFLCILSLLGVVLVACWWELI